MVNKPTIVYFNKDNFSQVDDTVLRHLTSDFHVIWFLYYGYNTHRRLSPEDAQKYADTYGIELRIRSATTRVRYPQNFFFFKRIVQEINDINPALVYHCERTPYWTLAIRLFLKCKIVILGVHDAIPHTYGHDVSTFLDVKTSDYALKIHKHFVTFSKNQQEVLRTYRGIESEMVGMSSKSFGQSKLSAPSFDTKIELLFFGSIRKYKGLDLLIKALENLRKKGIDNFHLTIAGRGPEWAEYEKMIQTPEMYNLQVRFIENDEIPDLFSSHHFLVLPYRDATQSGPLVAAIAYEIPVIAPNFGYFKDVLTNDDARLYEPGNLEQCLEKISRMSADEYKNLKQGCKVLKDNNSEEAVAQNYIKFFNKLLIS